MAARRLGRGLDFFLSGSSEAEAPEVGEEVTSSVAVDALAPNPHQPRRTFPETELKELAASIAQSGILQPILVRKTGDQHQIIAGERRWRAARLAGLEAVPVLVREISDEQAAVFGLVENLHREDLNPIEKAMAFRQIQRLANSSQEEVAKQVGLDRSTVTNFLRLLELPKEVQDYVSRGTLSMGQARAILGVPDDQRRKELAERAIRDRLSVRDVEAAAKDSKAAAESEAAGARGKSGKDGKDSKAKEVPLWLREIEDNLGEALNAKVSVRYGRKRSRIQIDTGPRADFERIYELLRGLEDSAS